MISPNKLNYLRRTSGEDVVRQFSDYTSGQFSEHGIPVVIAARNEESDLPATLVALADSRELVRPIVVENGSNDRTEEFANTMGAVVLTGAVHKMDALHMGVKSVVEQGRGGRSVLFTDADTLVGRDWAASLNPDGHHTGESHVRFGSVIYTHGETPHVDAVRTVYAHIKDLSRLVRGRDPIGRGANMGIHFSDEDGLYDEYLQLPPDLFVAEEEKIAEIVTEQNGGISRALGLRAIVVTRGDRYQSLKDLVRLAGPKGLQAKAASYEEDYGRFTPNNLDQ